ncbi:TPA_asm: QacE family quaternary ammonium compound efflux SMR transporter, partial [Listeria monocytogenes]|nr:QacE family quaternary ammonium compound efflux SMR transporter [Listeria monocytogenes]
KKIPVSAAYAIWSGVGIVAIAVIGVLFFKENVNAIKVVSILLIVAGVVGLNLGGVAH